MDKLNERMVFNSFGYSLKHFSMNYYKPVPNVNSNNLFHETKEVDCSPLPG